MNDVVSNEQWLKARIALLAKEKQFTAARDELARAIRALPWRKVEQDYRFDGPDGETSLAGLFDGKSQLIVYHFMYDPDWTEGCKSCSLIADHFDPVIIHLTQRDVAFAAIARASLATLEAFKQRMGWRFDFLSSGGNSFNFDFRVSFTPQQIEQKTIEYNYQPNPNFSGPELPGLSVFAKNDADEVFHTYSCYARGLDTFLGVYRLLDIVPRGRNEEGLSHGMAWVRHHDRYDTGQEERS
jgi:predicted dithiol-disulfide oxidoreductase (DUF899 family)